MKFNTMWTWTSFKMGIGVFAPYEWIGYKLCIDLDLGFFSMWVYFWKIKTKT